MNTKKKAITYLTIITLVLALIIIAYLLASSHFNLLDFLVKLHGG